MLGRVKRAFIGWCESAWADAQKVADNIEELVDSIKQFLVILREGVIDYYQLMSFEHEDHLNPYISNEENIQSACTAILFKDPLFYQLVFRAVNAHCQE